VTIYRGLVAGGCQPRCQWQSHSFSSFTNST
jgi:hypothetical protein